MSFNAIRENKILAKTSESAVFSRAFSPSSIPILCAKCKTVGRLTLSTGSNQKNVLACLKIADRDTLLQTRLAFKKSLEPSYGVLL